MPESLTHAPCQSLFCNLRCRQGKRAQRKRTLNGSK